jgi:feruloyl esterase
MARKLTYLEMVIGGYKFFRYLSKGGLGPGGWASWITGSAPGTSFDFLVADNFFTYMVFEKPSWDWRTFKFDGDVAFTDVKGGYINANSADYRDFKTRGAKMIMYHGWSDPAISPLDSIDHYNSVVAFMGHHKQQHHRWQVAPYVRRRSSSAFS